MVKAKDTAHLLADGSIDLHAWLDAMQKKYPYEDVNVIHHASVLCQLASEDKATESGHSCLQQGLAIAEILADLNLAPDVLAAAIVYESVQFAELSVDDVQEQLGPEVAKLVRGVDRMSSIDTLRKTDMHHHSQLHNLRQMILAMIDDVRVVLIKLAERLRVLRAIAGCNTCYQQQIARDVMDIYAPLANRLGLGQIKWELEDLAFRYLSLTTYKKIAKDLKERRLDREKKAEQIVSLLNTKLTQAKVKNFKVFGRVKHIHSIHKKMCQKNLDLAQIYDATAVRVLVETEANCYQVLSLVHDLWQSLPAEYDDYIANPKPNGYRSLHTAVIGPQQPIFEVQIRTYQMHTEAELGVCAHWAYKEGQPSAHRVDKIAWLREVLQWQQEIAQSDATLTEINTEIIDDRVYVFTPSGDIIDLVRGATPLDFAYAIHTEIGHKCRGAKIDGSIVSLTHTLQTADQVEILTTANGTPSRDWLGHDNKYLKTSRARAKVLHWFKQQDYAQNLIDGKELFNRETRRLNLNVSNLDEIATKFNYKTTHDFFAALGRGDVRRTQVVAHLSPLPKTHRKKSSTTNTTDSVVVDGISNLKTRHAQCCKPVGGDDIVGYITLARVISIHKADCTNVVNISAAQQQRLLEVSWAQTQRDDIVTEISITARDRQGLLNDITGLIKRDNALLQGVNSSIDDSGIMHATCGLRIRDFNALSSLLEQLCQINNVIEAKRKS
jgi:GTP pyrophosphokinase